MPHSPFEADLLDDIFKFDSDHENRLSSRESGKLEFKEAFNLGNAEDYAKTIAAFANTAGGYLVFGIKDTPRELIGLRNENFQSLDPARFTQKLNQWMAPELQWEPFIHTVKNKKVGIIYVSEAFRKPVVCTTMASPLQEGAIYYRYRGRSEKIRYPELRSMLDDELRRERELWMKHVQKMARIGIENVAIMDTVTGEVAGRSGQFLISEELLPRLKFINSGTFVESGGQPTLRVIGEVSAISDRLVQPTQFVRQPLHAPDIINAFLRQENVLAPMDYVTHVCFESSAFLPVFFFISQSSLTLPQVVAEVERCSSRSTAKAKLLGRLNSPENLKHGILGGSHQSGAKRKAAFDQIVARTIADGDVATDVTPFLQAITHLDRATDLNFVLGILSRVVMPRYTMLSGSELSTMRRAICHLDRIWFEPAVTPIRS